MREAIGVIIGLVGFLFLSLGLLGVIRGRAKLGRAVTLVAGALVLVVGIGVMAIAGAILPSSRVAPTTTARAATHAATQAKPKPKAVPVPSAVVPKPKEPTPQESASAFLRKVVLNHLDANTGYGAWPNTIRSIKVGATRISGAPATDVWSADIYLETGDNLDQIKQNSALIFQDAFTANAGFLGIELHWWTPLVGVRGNDHNTEVATVTMLYPTANSINWSNFDYNNLPQVADLWTLNPTWSGH